MKSNVTRFLGAGALFASLVLANVGQAAEPIHALLVTGGCCHDYGNQKEILAKGISARANVRWTVIHEGGTGTQHKVSVYARENWSGDYDIVVHNECFAHERDAKWLKRIVDGHGKGGTPAVLIHCAMHCYRAKSNDWFQFNGVTSHRHGKHYPFEVKNLKPQHPVMKGFPASWTTPKGELYHIAKVWPTATPLAHARSDRDKDEVCVWTNQYVKARVFGTTIGHYNETMQQKEYLDLVARGLLWACGKLDKNGQPKPGYGPPK